MSKLAIFVGPSIRPQDRLGFPATTFRPPARCGDIVRCLKDDISIIGIVDGAFKDTRSIWHKEILWALQCGVQVVGGGSMGALRAVELQRFGMQGVGKIWEWYNSGALEDDDEVAVCHAPAEMDYVSITIPMVNLRATVAYCRLNKLIADDHAELSLRLAKAIFYPNRTWNTIQSYLENIVGVEKAKETITTLRKHEVDQKRLDAIALIRFIHNLPWIASRAISWDFEWTEFWDDFYWDVHSEN